MRKRFVPAALTSAHTLVSVSEGLAVKWTVLQCRHDFFSESTYSTEASFPEVDEMNFWNASNTEKLNFRIFSNVIVMAKFLHFGALSQGTTAYYRNIKKKGPSPTVTIFGLFLFHLAPSPARAIWRIQPRQFLHRCMEHGAVVWICSSEFDHRKSSFNWGSTKIRTSLLPKKGTCEWLSLETSFCRKKTMKNTHRVSSRGSSGVLSRPRRPLRWGYRPKRRKTAPWSS